MVKVADNLTQAARGLTGEDPNLDFGLVTLARALDLPSGSSIALFALGRTMGWIAHGIEQYGNDQLIRPRARYVGPTNIMTSTAGARNIAHQNHFLHSEHRL